MIPSDEDKVRPDPVDIDALFDSLLDLDREAPTAGSLGPGLLADAFGIELPTGDADRRWGPFRFLRTIGHGGSSQVHLAARDDGQFDQRVAVKVLRTEVDDAASRERLTRERAILARMDHPRIARLIDGGIGSDGRPWFAMTFVEGEPITDHARRHRLSTTARLRLFRQLLSAVDHLHRNLIVHRDLKPGNILVTPDGDVMLLDLGISKLLEPDPAGEPSAITQSALTPAYAAPEQILGQPTTTAVDIYALGVILFELVTGRYPFAAGRFLPSGPGGLGQPAAPQPPDLGNDMDAILLRALAATPSERYGTVDALADDLNRYESGRPVSARADGFGYRLSRSIGRNRWAWAALLGLVLSLVAGFTTTWLKAREARLAADQSRAVSEFMVRLFETTDPDLETGAPLTARRLLDRGASELDRELEHQPQLRARLLGVLGNLYGKIGEYATADSILDLAAALDAATPGATLHDDVALLNDRGEVALALGRTARAESLHREALERLQALPIPEAIDLAATRHLLSSTLRASGALAPAESLALLALEGRRRHLPAGHLDLAHSLNDLAVIAFDRGRYAEAESLFRESLGIYEESPERGSLRAEALRSNLAVLMVQQGRFAEAEPLFRTALATQQRRLGSDHPRVAHTLQGLAGDVQRLGRFAEAESLFREALRINRLSRGDRHPEVAKTLHDLARVLQERGSLAEAGEALLACRDILVERLGPEHVYVGKTLSAIGDLELARGRPAEARDTFRRAHAILAGRLGPTHDLTASARFGLARALHATGADPEAVLAAREASSAFQELFGPNDRRTREAEALVAAIGAGVPPARP